MPLLCPLPQHHITPPPTHTTMQLASPEDACTPFSFTDYDSLWVALISRHQQYSAAQPNCTFDVKVGGGDRGQRGGEFRSTEV